MKIVPAKIGEMIESCQYIRVSSVLGVGGEWNVYAPVENEDHIFFGICEPTDGPVRYLREWARTPQEVVEFPFSNYGSGSKSYMAAFKRATRWSRDEAINDLTRNFL